MQRCCVVLTGPSLQRHAGVERKRLSRQILRQYLVVELLNRSLDGCERLGLISWVHARQACRSDRSSAQGLEAECSDQADDYYHHTKATSRRAERDQHHARRNTNTACYPSH